MFSVLQIHSMDISVNIYIYICRLLTEMKRQNGKQKSRVSARKTLSCCCVFFFLLKDVFDL